MPLNNELGIAKIAKRAVVLIHVKVPIRMSATKKRIKFFLSKNENTKEAMGTRKKLRSNRSKTMDISI